MQHRIQYPLATSATSGYLSTWNVGSFKKDFIKCNTHTQDFEGLVRNEIMQNYLTNNFILCIKIYIKYIELSKICGYILLYTFLFIF